MKKLPLYKCNIKDDDETGIYAMSFVDYPAVEVDFIALSKAEHKLHLNQDKQILTGAILIPDQIIYRNDNGYEYNISFDADQIEKISHKMMKNSIVLHNTTHQHQSELSDNYLIEMWIIEDPDNDKSNALGFKNLPKGTMMASYKITNSDYWMNEVKTGNVKGFSLEGYFYDNRVDLKKDNQKELSIKENIVEMQKENTSLINRILKAINMSMDEVDSKDATESGKNFKEFTLKDGKVIKVDEEGFATIDGEQAPSGEHILSDDAVIVINAEGYMVETVEEVKSEEPAVPETELADETPADEPKAEDAPVEKFKVEIDGTEYEVDEAVANYIAALQGEIASLTEDKTASDAELATLKKNTPSVQPVNVMANKAEKKYTEMSRAEQIAYQMRSVLK